MRHTEFRARLEAALGDGYASYWAGSHVVAALEGRTPQEALDAGESPKAVWAEVWRELGLPDRDR